LGQRAKAMNEGKQRGRGGVGGLRVSWC
jgi:hypothetical protein